MNLFIDENKKKTNIYKAKITTGAKSNEHKSKIKYKEGTEVYRHPEGWFVVLEFQGKIGKFREAFRPDEIVKVGRGNGKVKEY